MHIDIYKQTALFMCNTSYYWWKTSSGGENPQKMKQPTITGAWAYLRIMDTSQPTSLKSTNIFSDLSVILQKSIFVGIHLTLRSAKSKQGEDPQKMKQPAIIGSWISSTIGVPHNQHNTNILSDLSVILR